MSKVTVYKVPQYMSNKVNVICVDGIPVCTARGNKTTSDIVAKLSGYDIEIKDGRIDLLVGILAQQLADNLRKAEDGTEKKTSLYKPCAISCNGNFMIDDEPCVSCDVYHKLKNKEE